MKAWLSETGDDSVDLSGLEEKIKRSVKNFKFNTVVSAFMEFLAKNKAKRITPLERDRLLAMLRVFAPGFLGG
jgi:leucyl-tRNA synthetase